MGRRGKISIRKIENSSSRQVTFCKRKQGLLRKAEQLSILCDVEVGVVICSNTNRLYEYSSSSMKSLFERYNKEKQAHHQLLTPVAEAKVQLWKREADSLRQQLQDMQERYRQLKGEHLSGLRIGDLQNLQSQFEASLKCIHSAKNQKLIEEIEELNQKASESLLLKENMELHKKLGIMNHENALLHKKVHAVRYIGRSEGCSTSGSSFSKEHESHISTSLQLKQVQAENSGHPIRWE